jgi:DNA polymerase-3 subunit gamma/tau
MFENIIGQAATARLMSDIQGNVLAPSMLFAGPAASAKGTAAIELARILSCETEGGSNPAPWNCACSSCLQHKTLSSPDLLLMGPRDFSREIFAAKASFLREPKTASAKTLFLRQIRKLLCRFSPDLLADDPKTSKYNGTLESLNDDVEEFIRLTNATSAANQTTGEANAKQNEKIIKLCDAIVKNALKLEAEGIAETIPVLQIRNASYWLRHKPAGKKKVLIIENADQMQDSSRNSLLKILEEPPESAALILTSSKPQTLLPTILSRLRQYVFVKRTDESEKEIIRRVYKDSVNSPGLVNYFDTFLPVSRKTLYAAAMYFWASILNTEKKGAAEFFGVMRAYCASHAAEPGFENPARDIKTLCAVISAAGDKFQARNTYPDFLSLVCSTLSEILLRADNPLGISLRDIVLKNAEKSRLAFAVFNQSSILALERFCADIKNDIARL